MCTISMGRNSEAVFGALIRGTVGAGPLCHRAGEQRRSAGTGWKVAALRGAAESPGLEAKQQDPAAWLRRAGDFWVGLPYACVSNSFQTLHSPSLKYQKKIFHCFPQTWKNLLSLHVCCQKLDFVGLFMNLGASAIIFI